MNASPAPSEVLSRRLCRARELAALWPFSREVLEIFSAVTELQRGVLDRLPVPLPEDPGAMARFLPPLLELVERRGPVSLVEAVYRWRARSPAGVEKMLREYWVGEGGERGEPAERFFAKAILAPYVLQRRRGWREEPSRGADRSHTCPCCGHRPGVSVLREEKGSETLARSLVCSLCSLEWSFARVLCPACTEERPEKLPRFTADEIPWIRIEACDACGSYLKAVDLTRTPGADPVVDELASTPLDILAREEGYVKLEANLAGM